MTWFVVIFGLGLLVFLHELGHFSVARLVGIKTRDEVGALPEVWVQRLPAPGLRVL